MPEFQLGGESVKSNIRYYEVLEPQTAQTLATFSNIEGHPPAVTVNRFGKGQAIYLAAPAQSSLIGPIVHSLSLGIHPGPKTPEGVYARLVNGRTLYVNTTDQEKDFPIGMKGNGILSHQSYDGEMKLGPYQVDLVE
jgi:beta-galactosidase